ncbi:response regulator transcription factor [Roseburia sp. MSJ-14]|uniref:response regulator transcription factor n=1 Tax=Roseburia sp. MSJ-14 TaxID=2841514 RepID=UPI001C1180ED|nr:helix-turn-helix transcriptional regulator [Roseburia sp. MSJ-14]MBU5474456.1 helix-turn-helix transcriptional regulator [Roseburia sp. MSJ-14]
MENAGELLPILKLVEDDEIDHEYLKKVIFHCQQYQTGQNLILNKGEGQKEASLLTERELEILQLVKTGYKNGEIGKTLNIATVTVEKALSNIYRKLNVKGRTEAVKKLEKVL